MKTPICCILDGKKYICLLLDNGIAHIKFVFVLLMKSHTDISGFSRGVIEVFLPVGYCAEWVDIWLPTWGLPTGHAVLLDCLALEVWDTKGCPETSAKNYQLSPSNISEERRRRVSKYLF